HRYNRRAIAIDARLVSQRFREGLAEANRDVFDRVVIIYVEITSTLHFEIEQPVAREQLEHVIEKRHTGFDPRPAGSIEAERYSDVGLLGLSPYFCRPRLCLFSFHNMSLRLCESLRLCAKPVRAKTQSPAKTQSLQRFLAKRRSTSRSPRVFRHRLESSPQALDSCSRRE